jgi:glycolate oxidase FAD binding subunit
VLPLPVVLLNQPINANNQALSFYTDNDDMSIGAVYANGAQDISDSVLGVQIINGTGVLLNFGGQVIKNARY